MMEWAKKPSHATVPLTIGFPGFFHAESSQSARFFLQSSGLGPPTPSTTGECVPPLAPGGGRGQPRLRERGRRGPKSDKGTNTVVLYTANALYRKF
jgi:hypothetical protein